MPLRFVAAIILSATAACAGPQARPDAPTDPGGGAEPEAAPRAEVGICGDGSPMHVRFYDVKQALAALVELPDGRVLLVDTGEMPNRPGCGAPCRDAHAELLTDLERDLAGRPIDLLWITHLHSDHIGGTRAILERFTVKHYVDNGEESSTATVRKTREAVELAGIPWTRLRPGAPDLPIPDTEWVDLAAIVPDAWPVSCSANPNECSIGLRIDYCNSSVLFTGDAEHAAEAAWKLERPVTLLQVGHHGSATSSTQEFLDALSPDYAVVSSGKPNEGTNRTYCHPERGTLERLHSVVPASATRTLTAFDRSAGTCSSDAAPSLWTDIEVSARIYVTAQDGDVVLTTTGDGVFVRQEEDVP